MKVMENMQNSLNKIVILDHCAIGNDLDYSELEKIAPCDFYSFTKAEDILERSDNADIIITNKVELNKEVLIKLPKLKLICVAATGMNNIDLEYCEKAGIKVLNVKGYSTASVVQHTFCFALNFLTSAQEYYRYTASGEWLNSPVFTSLDYSNTELENKSWGIIGLGTIGKKVATIAKAFGAQTSYFSTSGLNHDHDIPELDLETLLRTSDIISIHAPLSDRTYNLISKKELSFLKPGAILINMARGQLINSKDLAEKIELNDSYFGIDVLENEPYLKDDPIYKVKNKKNLLLTPHTAWASKEARSRLLSGIVENIKLTFNL